MIFTATTLWWLAAGIAVAAELATGTFYLLMIAFGLAAAAIAAHLGLAAPMQLGAAALLGGGATFAWYWRQRRERGTGLPPARNRDVNLDIGERVHVAAWAADGTAQVSYRGSGWAARLQPGAPPLTGEHAVVAVEGNWLVLAPRAQPSNH